MRPSDRTVPATAKLLVAVLGVTALVLGACSSGGSDATTTTTATPATGSATTTIDGPIRRYADYQSENYRDPSHWVCRPDLADDPCHGDLDATSIAPDGTLTVQRFERAEDPPIDCFYVYPTISRDETAFSDWDASPDEEDFVTVQQAARLGSQCRVFAPVYRQATLTSLTARLGGGTVDDAQKGDPYADVLDAFRTYLAKDNDGRGFVLIGHSQGAGILAELLAAEVDPNADVRAKLVGAYLAGTSVGVPADKEVGGDLQHIPLCTETGEAGCLVTWSTFRSTAPPPADAYFGRTNDDGDPAGCVNPAAPSGGKADVHPYFPSDASASILSSLNAGGSAKPWVEGGAEITTPFVTLPGLVTAECTSTGGVTFLQATVHGDPSDRRADDISGDLTPEWGLHLVDVSLVMGDVVKLVGEQAEAYVR